MTDLFISEMELTNWRNFSSVKISLGDRTFIIGANATGKSNLLDAFRFLRDVVRSGGGFQEAVRQRGGVSKIRYLNARQNPFVSIRIRVSEFENSDYTWEYSLRFGVEPRGKRRTYIVQENLSSPEGEVFSRPNAEDKADPTLLSQTYLEQITQNGKFRPLVEMLEGINYFHLVPQLLRYPEAFSGPDLPNDPFGRGFLTRIARTPEKKRATTLRRISRLMSRAVPQLKELTFEPDEVGHPHLKAIYDHWRPHAGKQREVDFSDGTLRLIALLWTIFENQGIVLLEEPELSLNQEIVAKLPDLFYQIQKNLKRKHQYVVTTHSEALLSDRSIALKEIQMLTPGKEGTLCQAALEIPGWKEALQSGLSPAEIVMEETKPGSSD